MPWIRLGDVEIEITQDELLFCDSNTVIPSEETLARKMKQCHRLAEFYSNEAKRYHNQILEYYYKDKGTNVKAS